MDPVFRSWLEHQYEASVALAAASDVVTVLAAPGPRPPQRFIARFRGPTLVREETAIARTDGFVVLFQFPDDYLRSVTDAAQIVCLLEPANAFHPNVAYPFVCIGHVAPGTGLVELIYQVYEMLGFQKMTPREDDALNPDACVWARRHMHLFPLSTAPLRRRAAAFAVDKIHSAEEHDEPQSD